MASLKNITELPVAESTEGLNLIVNDNGAAKQIAADAVISQQEQVNWEQNDSTKADYIKSRPFYKEINKVIGNYSLTESYITDAYDGWIEYSYEFSDSERIKLSSEKGGEATITVNDTVYHVYMNDFLWFETENMWFESQLHPEESGFSIMGFSIGLYEMVEAEETVTINIEFDSYTYYPIDNAYLTNTTTIYKGEDSVKSIFLSNEEYDWRVCGRVLLDNESRLIARMPDGVGYIQDSLRSLVLGQELELGNSRTFFINENLIPTFSNALGICIGLSIDGNTHTQGAILTIDKHSIASERNTACGMCISQASGNIYTLTAKAENNKTTIIIKRVL